MAADLDALRRVLVVENDSPTAQLLTDLLTAAGYAVTVLSSGFGVRQMVRHLRPRAVVLDLGLPYRSGAAVLAALKADPVTAPVPVVVVSVLEATLSPARASLAVAQLPRPLSAPAVLDAVETATSVPGSALELGLRAAS